MKKCINSTILSILASFFLITGCQPIGQVNQLTPKSPLLQREGTSAESSISAQSSLLTLHSSVTTIKGKVEFPEENPSNSLYKRENNITSPFDKGGKGDLGSRTSSAITTHDSLLTKTSRFTTQATLGDIAPGATVSLLYPPNHPINPNVTVSTGLTDAPGNFLINPSSIFAPAVNDVFILEAVKRIGGNGNALLTLRTYIRWNGATWDSITNPGIYINTKTTALTIISGLNPSLITPLQTIGTMPVVNGISSVNDITGTTVTSIMINDVKDLVTRVLEMNYDPVNYIKLVNGKFTILEPLSTNIIYVNTNATGINDGTSWSNAYTSLQAALSFATGGNDIWIAAGTYKPGTLVTDSFQLKAGVGIYGGFTGIETQISQRNYNANVVTLSGDLNNTNSANAGDSYHVVKGATGATLDGVTIKFGYANGSYSPDDQGGGMFNDYCSPTLINVIFTTNSANNKGGGIFNSSSSPVLTNVTFSNNYSWNNGGGMYNNYSSPALSNVTFSTNSASYGGGIYNNNSSPVLSNVTFSNNFGGNGGGIYNYFSSPPLTKVTFTSNSGGDGGAIYNQYSSPTLTNVTFTSNFSTGTNGGGGIFNYYSSPTLTNVDFTSNSSTGKNGGGMFNNFYSSPTLTKVTFSTNSATNGGGMFNNNSSPVLSNVTFSNNSATNGGGMNNNNSSPVLSNVTFSTNSATNGGGMHNNYNSSPVLSNVTFSNNSTSSGNGGGMYNDHSSPTLINIHFLNNSTSSGNGGGMYNYFSSSPTLTNVTFSTNSAYGSGGGLYNDYSYPTLTNIVFSNNSATFYGGGMFNWDSSATITNVTFSANNANNAGGGMCNSSSSQIIKNTIFWGNTSPDGKSINNGSTSTINIGYSDVEGGFTGITGGGTIKDVTGTTILDVTTFPTVGNNISANPLFLSPLNLAGVNGILMTSDDGLSLQSGSPARNAGIVSNSPATSDIAGVGRPKGSGFDMGAYEYIE